jgi:type II secretory pathway component PulC
MSPGPSFESSKAAAPVAVKVYSKESGQIVQKPEFCVTGIIHGDGSPMAVINGVVYTCGETIRGATVAKISENEVVLQRFGKRIELKVK